MTQPSKRRYDALTSCPIFSDMERALLYAMILTRPCKACHAPAGKACTNLPDSRHIGRVPPGFRTLSVVETALRKLDLPVPE